MSYLFSYESSLILPAVSLEQALHLGESQELTRAQHAKGDASTFARHTWRAC